MTYGDICRGYRGCINERHAPLVKADSGSSETVRDSMHYAIFAYRFSIGTNISDLEWPWTA